MEAVKPAEKPHPEASMDFRHIPALVSQHSFHQSTIKVRKFLAELAQVIICIKSMQESRWHSPAQTFYCHWHPAENLAGPYIFLAAI